MALALVTRACAVLRLLWALCVTRSLVLWCLHGMACSSLSLVSFTDIDFPRECRYVHESLQGSSPAYTCEAHCEAVVANAREMPACRRLQGPFNCLAL